MAVFDSMPMHPEVIDLCSCSDQDSLADETKPSPRKKRHSDEQEVEAADSTLEGRRRRHRKSNVETDNAAADQDDEPITTPSSSSSLVVAAVELYAKAEAAESRTSVKDESSQLQPLLLFLKSEDDAVLTTINSGVLLEAAVAAASSSASTKNKMIKSNKTKSMSKNKVHLIATLNLVHIGQPDRWSCGFRNWQMLLSFVVPLLPPNHSYYRHNSGSTAVDSAVASATTTTSTTTRFYEIPSVRDLQSNMEQCWAEGFDPDGARHYGGTIVGRRSWIGALEVSACLSYLGIDNTVVQFIRCFQSRQELEPFCVRYFASSDEESSSSRVSESSRTRATALLQRSGSSPTGTRGNNSSSNINNHRGHLPLYLQWEGHSVTAIGVEQSATMGDGTTYHLLVLNPARSGVAIETAVRRHNLAPLRLPFAQLRNKDTQILLPSTYSLSVWERNRLRGPAQALTAAMDHVQRAMARPSRGSNSRR
jgi:hypothetical protein